MFLKKKEFLNRWDNSLFFSCFFHVFSCLCSAFLDYKNNDANVLTISYFFRFFIWWSFNASILSLISFIYLLIRNWWRDSDYEYSYREQIFHLIVANSNLVSLFIFLLCSFLYYFFNMKLIPVSDKEAFFYWTYAFVWHFLSTILSLKSFCKLDISLISKDKLKSSFYSFVHPLLYFLFVAIRSANLGHTEKRKYPYSPLGIPMKNYNNKFLGLIVQFAFLLGFFTFFYISSYFLISLNRSVNSEEN